MVHSEMFTFTVIRLPLWAQVLVLAAIALVVVSLVLVLRKRG